MQPIVSIIIPVYNGQKTIALALESLQKQMLRDIEVIVVNDCSTDNTSAICHEFASTDSRFSVIDLSENLGVYCARATAFDYCIGKWIAFVDADDLVHKKMYLEMVEVAEREGVDLVVCSANLVSREKKIIERKVRYYRNKKITQNIFEKFCKYEFGTGALWNKLYRKEVIKKWISYGHAIRQDTNEDVLVNLGVFRNVRSVYQMSFPYYKQVRNPDSVTSKVGNQRAFIFLLQAFWLALEMAKKEGFNQKEISEVVQLYRIQLIATDYSLDSFDAKAQSLMGFMPIWKLLATQYPAETLFLISRLPKGNQRSFAKKIYILLMNWMRP